MATSNAPEKPVPPNSGVAERYDQLAYQTAPISHAQPQRMAAMLHMMGLPACEPCTARILEVGCSTGGNILSLAAILPKATLLGIDISSTQISTAEKMAQTAELKNVRFRCQDLATLDPKDGSFDYIIAHGVFSWIEPNLQQKLLQACSRCLSPQGAAYISFNCLPGWHIRGIVRDAMLFASRTSSTLGEQLKHSRAMVELMAQGLSRAQSPSVRPAKEELALRAVLAQEFAQASAMPDWYLAHDFISAANNPLYFHEFHQLLQREQLQYVGDLELAKNFPLEQPLEVQKLLASIADDQLRYEQYLDFLRARFFRRALIVRQSNTPALRAIPARLEPLTLSTGLRFQGKESAAGSQTHYHFQSSTGAALRTQDALLAEVIASVAASGDTICATVLETVLQKLPEDQRSARRTDLLQNLSRLWSSELVYAQWGAAAAASTPPARPRGSALARAQSKLGTRVSTLRHEEQDVMPLAAHVLDMLDGKSTSSELSDVFGPLALSLGRSDSEQAFQQGLQQLLDLGLVHRD